MLGIYMLRKIAGAYSLDKPAPKLFDENEEALPAPQSQGIPQNRRPGLGIESTVEINPDRLRYRDAARTGTRVRRIGEPSLVPPVPERKPVPDVIPDNTPKEQLQDWMKQEKQSKPFWKFISNTGMPAPFTKSAAGYFSEDMQKMHAAVAREMSMRTDSNEIRPEGSFKQDSEGIWRRPRPTARPTMTMEQRRRFTREADARAGNPLPGRMQDGPEMRRPQRQTPQRQQPQQPPQMTMEQRRRFTREADARTSNPALGRMQYAEEMRRPQQQTQQRQQPQQRPQMQQPRKYWINGQPVTAEQFQANRAQYRAQQAQKFAVPGRGATV